MDRSNRIRQTVAHVLERDHCLRLRDAPATVFGAARGSLTGLYKRADELHAQLEGTLFEDILAGFPAPQAEARFKTNRHLENDLTVNTAGLMAFGPYDYMWGAWASFNVTCYAIISGMFRDQFPKDVRSTLSDMSTFLRSGFAYVPLTRCVFVCKFPRVYADEQQRVHSDDGPAIQFDDGYKIFALRGLPVAEEIVKSPQTLDPKRIEEERNVELRRVLIEKYGIGRYLHDTGAGIMDKTECGTLYLKQQPGDEPIAIVQVRNSTAEPDGSYKDYFLRVPPNVRTVQEAIAWTFGMDSHEYKPDLET